MSIEIRHLPPEIQELAHQRQREQGNDGTFDGDISDGKRQKNFDWHETSEEQFWNDLYSYGIERVINHPAYPTPFIEQY